MFHKFLLMLEKIQGKVENCQKTTKNCFRKTVLANFEKIFVNSEFFSDFQ